LMSAGYKLPEKLLVHGYLNLGGQKISKSLGNVIDPIELVKKYGADSVRYSLLRCSVFEDSDYSEEILIERNNNELANKLGNLISRVTTLAEKYGLEKTENKLLKKLSPIQNNGTSAKNIAEVANELLESSLSVKRVRERNKYHSDLLNNLKQLLRKNVAQTNSWK